MGPGFLGACTKVGAGGCWRDRTKKDWGPRGSLGRGKRHWPRPPQPRPCPELSGLRDPGISPVCTQDARFVEERRKLLQTYLRSVMNKVIQALPEFASSPRKETLVQLIPFFV